MKFFYFLTCLVASQLVFAQGYDVRLLDNDGGATKIADLTLNPVEGGYAYTLDMITDEPFSEFFLSMRPFRCLTHSQKKLNYCYLSYPYENKHFISSDSLIDLEYDLLFIRRKSSEHGIDPWFGSYYQLSWNEDKIDGQMHEVDLGILAAPPEKGNLRPITSVDLTEVRAENFWFPKLQITPKP